MSIFSEIVTGKSVLFAPVYSMRSHKTGKYDLAADGNFHRVIGCIRKYKPKRAIVLIPDDDKLADKHFYMHIPEVNGTDQKNKITAKVYLRAMPEAQEYSIQRIRGSTSVCTRQYI